VLTAPGFVSSSAPLCKYSGQTVKVDGDELLVMKEEDLFAVVEK